MRPRNSHRQERVLGRIEKRTRPPGHSPLQPRDKNPTFQQRHMKAAYARTMSHAHDTLKQREVAFARWLDWVASEKKRTEGWSTEETINHSTIDRSTWYRWKKISRPGWMPKPATLDGFCKSLGLNLEMPYRILGWGRPTSKPVELPESPPESDLDRQIRLIKVRLDQEPPTEERRRLERLLVRAKRQREELRQMDEEIAELLGGADEPSDDRP